MNLRTVWQSINDGDGYHGQTGGDFFWSREMAHLAGDGYRGHPQPMECKAIEFEDGSICLLGPEITVYNDPDQVIREQALSKLSVKERKALGF